MQLQTVSTEYQMPSIFFGYKFSARAHVFSKSRLYFPSRPFLPSGVLARHFAYRGIACVTLW
jgi:hypothetical protein